MEDVKRCVLCGAVIAYECTADWYAYIRMKYCNQCREQVKRTQTARRMRKFRERNRLANRERKTQLDLLKQENELLRRRVARLREYEEAYNNGG